MKQTNIEIRKAAKNAGVNFWKIAAYLGIADSTFSRWLRTELTQETKAQCMAAIEKLKEREQNG